MLTFLTILIGALDLASLVFAAAKFWRLACSLLVSASAISVICVLWESPTIRLVGGFHVVVVFLTAGLLWECYRGNLKDK